MCLGVRAHWTMTLAVLSDDTVNGILERPCVVMANVLVRAEDGVADCEVLLDTFVDIHTEPS